MCSSSQLINNTRSNRTGPIKFFSHCRMLATTFCGRGTALYRFKNWTMSSAVHPFASPRFTESPLNTYVHRRSVCTKSANWAAFHRKSRGKLNGINHSKFGCTNQRCSTASFPSTNGEKTDHLHAVPERHSP